MSSALYEVLDGFWRMIEPVAAPFLAHIGIHQAYELLTALMIIAIASAFAVQIFAWSTPPNPFWGHAVALGAVSGILAYMLISWKASLIPAVLGACIVGVYGWQGQIYTFALLALIAVFWMNILGSWKSNRPLEVLQ